MSGENNRTLPGKMMEQLDICCYKYNTKRGSIVIGILCLVVACLTLVGAPLTMVKFEEDMDNLLQVNVDNWTPMDRQQYDTALTVIRAANYGLMVMAVLDAICSALLIYGTRKEKANYVLTWVVEQLALLPVWLVLWMAYVVVIFQMSWTQQGLYYLFHLVLHTALTVYWILVVYSQYRKLRGQQAPYDQRQLVSGDFSGHQGPRTLTSTPSGITMEDGRNHVVGRSPGVHRIPQA